MEPFPRYHFLVIEIVGFDDFKGIPSCCSYCWLGLGFLSGSCLGLRFGLGGSRWSKTRHGTRLVRFKLS